MYWIMASRMIWQRDLWRSLDASIYYNIDYDDAGAFVAYLIDSHGLAAYLEAMADLPALSTRPAIDRVFRDVFGVTLAASVAEFAAERQTCPHDSYDRKLSECSAPKIDRAHHVLARLEERERGVDVPRRRRRRPVLDRSPRARSPRNVRT